MVEGGRPSTSPPTKERKYEYKLYRESKENAEFQLGGLLAFERGERDYCL
jgi:hypothetical protein